MWEIEYYVDEFGDPTNKGYIINKLYIKGYFSNSATTNADLNVRFLIGEDYVSIKLYEYAGNHPIKGNADIYNIYMKYNGKNLYDERKRHNVYRSHLRGDRLKLSQENRYFRQYFKIFLDTLKNGGKFQFYIEDYPPSSEYNFTIEDATGFENAYNHLLSLKEDK